MLDGATNAEVLGGERICRREHQRDDYGVVRNEPPGAAEVR